jgi:hypothetical protein
VKLPAHVVTEAQLSTFDSAAWLTIIIHHP